MSLLGFLALVPVAVAQADAGAVDVLAFNSTPSNAQAGKPITITWSGKKSTPVKISLKKGDANDLRTVAILADNATGGSFTWTPSSSLSSGDDYALALESDTSAGSLNYSGLFSLSGGGDSNSSPGSSQSQSGSSGAISTSLGIPSTSQEVSSPTSQQVSPSTSQQASPSTSQQVSSSTASTTTLTTSSSAGGLPSSTSTEPGDASVFTTIFTVAPSSTASAPPSSDATGLSANAKIAVGVSVPIGVVALVAVIFLLWRRRARSSKASALGTNTRPEKNALGIETGDRHGIEDERQRFGVGTENKLGVKGESTVPTDEAGHAR